MEIVYRTNRKTENANAFLFGLKGFSTYENLIVLDELKDYEDKKVFLSLDKNMFNKDLDFLEEVLSRIDNYNISGILFYDLAVLSLSKKLGVKTPLIWSGDYLVTNYKTCLFYKEDGVSGAVIPPIITKDEIIEINEKTGLDLFVPVFGYQVMALSKRNLISNYFDYIDEENDKKINYMIEKEDYFPTKENEEGTKIYTKDVLCAIRYINDLKKNNIKYLILDDFLLDENVFDKIYPLFERAVNEELTDEELISLEEEIKEIIPNTSMMFFDKKTVYKVKK